MNITGLNVVITSDTQSAVSGVKALTGSLNQAGTAAASAGTSVAGAVGAVNKIPPAANSATTAVNSLAQGVNSSASSLKTFEAQARAGQLTFTQYGQSAGKAVKGLSDLKNAAPNTGMALINLGRVAQDAPFGFIAIQNNIPPLIDSFQSLVKSTGSVTGALKSIGSAALGFGGIGLLVSVATSALTLFSLASRKSKDETEKLEKAQKSVSEVVRDATASVQGEVSTTQALSSILLDTNKSYEARNAALNKLKATGGDYFKSLSLEKSTYEQLKLASDKYTDSIVRASVVKGLQDQISSLAGELAKSAPIISKGFNDIVSKNPSDPFKQFGDSVVAGAKGIALNFRSADSLLAAGSRRVSSDISAAADGITKTTEAKFAKQEELQTRLKGFIDQLATTLSGTDTPDSGNTKAAKDIVTISDVLADLDKQLLKTNALFVNSGDTLKQLTNDQIRNYQNALAGLIDINILPGNNIFDQLKSRLDDLQRIQTPVKVIIPINPEFKIPAVATNSIFTKDLLNVHFRPQVNAFTANLNSLIQTSIETGIGSISEALGAALVTGDFSSFIGSFVGAISSFMQKLGASLIATGIGIEAFKASLESLQGVTAVIAGVGLIAAAAAFRAIAGGGVGSFATGGTAFGPQLAVIGDNPQRKEHILSDNQLQRISDNGGGELIGKFVLDGQLLSLAVQRANRSKNRIN